MIRLVPLVSAIILLLSLCPAPALAGEPAQQSASEGAPRVQKFIDVSLVQVPKTGGHDDLALVMGESSVRLLTLDPTSGNQRGRTLDVGLPPNPCVPPSPCKGIISKYFLPGHVLILNKDYSLYWMPVSLDMDGTPIPGAWECSPPLDGGSLGNGATALTELPGSLFRDGLPRLYIGNDEGLIIKIVYPNPGPPNIEGYISLLVGSPIRALAPIPQLGYVALGVSTGTVLHGISESSGSPEIIFERIWPPNPCTDFDVFESILFPPNPVMPIHIAYSTGVDPGLLGAELPADATGTGSLAAYSFPPSPVMPPSPMQFVLGSLLYVTADSTGVYYDPGFSEGGYSGCFVNLTGEIATGCICCVGLSGNVDCGSGDGVDISDLSALIDFLYITFTPLCCTEEANVDGQTGTDISDLSALIDYLYISFTTPAECQ